MVCWEQGNNLSLMIELSSLFLTILILKNGVVMKRIEWIRCPSCTNKTRDKIREDTVLKNYPLYCPKCKQESLIDAENLNIIVIKEPDALDAEPRNK